MDTHEWRHGVYTISTDPARFDVDVFHRYLSEESYWARGRLRETTDTAVANSMVFGAYADDGEMVGAARVVTDRITFSWLCDVFVLDAHRGRGLGRALVDAVMNHPDLAAVKRTMLATNDAHELYRSYGFEPLDRPQRWMFRSNPVV